MWNRNENSSGIPPGLHVVATPIGRLRDITLHALDVLHQADCIYAEDTRVTEKLLSHFGIKNHIHCYHDHNGEQVRPKIIEKLRDGARLALVCDAGTPLISDPGYKLVHILRQEGFPIHTAPGPSALTAALSVAGLPTDRFLFHGFLPSRHHARSEILSELKTLPSTLVFYETGHRLAAMLEDCKNQFGDRLCVIARELTKRYEEVRLDFLSDHLVRLYKQAAPKGELVVIIAGAKEEELSGLEEIKLLIEQTQLEQPGLRPKDIAKNLAQKSVFSSSEIYRLIVQPDDV